MAMSDLKTDGTELVVLSVLAQGPQYGYAISKRVAALSDGAWSIGAGQLYPLLSKLEKAKLVSASWDEVKAEGRDEGDAGGGRRRKWYRLTAKGRQRLDQRIEAHRRATAVLERFIGGADVDAHGGVA